MEKESSTVFVSRFFHGLLATHELIRRSPQSVGDELTKKQFVYVFPDNCSTPNSYFRLSFNLHKVMVSVVECGRDGLGYKKHFDMMNQDSGAHKVCAI